MKNKIFEKMREYGWNLGDNTDKDFVDVYNIHYNFIEGCYDYIANCDMNEPLNMNDISASGFEDMICFMSDFLRALNELNIEKRIEEIKKQLEYIEERDKVCCTFGCKGEKEELLVELEELENELERV